MKRKLFLLLCALLTMIGVQQVKASVDVTDTYLTNASLTTENSGWTYYSDAYKYQAWRTGNAELSAAVEFYSGWGSLEHTDFKFSQTPHLPKGYYRLSVNAFFRNGDPGDGKNPGKAWIFAGEKKQNVVPLKSGDLTPWSSAGDDMNKAMKAFHDGAFANAFDFNITSESGADIEIGFQGKFDGIRQWCILGPVKLYEYTAEDYIADYRVKVAEVEALYDTPMNADVLQALKDAIVDEATLVTVDDVINAIDALNAAIGNANTSIANYAEAKTILDAANGYDAAGQASYAADATIVAIQTAYDNNTLVSVSSEQKAAAQTALVVACKAQIQPADDCDMTAYIVNPNINGNVDGWTCNMNANGGYVGGPLKPSGDAMEFWAAGTLTDQDHGKSFDYYQQITGLPTGAYTISAQMLNSTNGEEGASWDGGGTSGLYGKTPSSEVQKLITVDSESFTSYTTDVILVVDGELRIGVKNIKAMTGRWFAATGFKLTYARQLTDEEKEEIAKKDAIARYNDAFAAATAISEGQIPSTAYGNLQTVIVNNTLVDGTSSEYNAAADALNEATEVATPLITPYDAWKQQKAKADVLVAVANDNAEANTTLATAINDQTTAANAATDISGIETATNTLKTAMITYAGLANPVGDGSQFDLTFMLTNPDVTSFWDGTWWIQPAGWYTDQTGGNFQVMANEEMGPGGEVFMEYWSENAKTSNFSLYQKVTLDKGTYKMTGRVGLNQDTGGNNANMTFSANETNGTKIAAGPLSDQEVEFVNTTDDTEVKIGIKAQVGNTYRWIGINNIKLYKVPAKTYIVSESVDWDNTISGAGDVTLTRTIKEGINTVVFPFSMTQAEVEDKFGPGSKVYVVESYNPKTENISFITQEEGILANQPCLLKATVAGTSYELEGRTIVAGEPTYVLESVSMIGGYNATNSIPEDNYNYIISGNKIYFVDVAGVTMKGTRAYIKVASSNSARELIMIIDGEDPTAIDSIEAGEEAEGLKDGKYLIDGKVVIVKNGVKYSANGQILK